MSSRLRAARLDKGLTIAQAAALIEVSEDTLARAELGQSTPHPPNAKAICDFFGFTVTEIWPVLGAEERVA